MTDEQYQAEMKYRLLLSSLRKMLADGLFTKAEFKAADAKLKRIYAPPLACL
jgi:hypothetical protein